MSEIRFARSLAGHDKDELYVMIGEEKDICFVANGTSRTLEHPKKKKRRHLQVIKRLPKEAVDVLTEKKQTNEAIKRALKIYVRSIECQKQM